MNKKTLIFASFIILACAVGFFCGAICISKCMSCPSKKAPCPFAQNAPQFHGPQFDGPEFAPHKGPHHKGPSFKGPGFKGPEFRKEGFKGPNPEFIDSMLQVTPEQKTALEQQRSQMDSTFKVLRSQKKEAEKALKQALDSGDAEKIKLARTQIMISHEAMLDHRIAGATSLAKILTKEQMEKFRDFQQKKEPPQK